MSEEKQAIVPVSEGGWRSRILMTGGLLGAFLGILSAYLYVKAAEETHGTEAAPETPQTNDAVKLGMALLAIVRTITEWGRR